MPGNAKVSRSRWSLLLKITSLILLIAAANIVADWLVDVLKFELRPSNEHIVHRMIMTAAVVYALLISIPFVPGVEIGLALIAVVGRETVLLVYLSTLVGLSISFFVGRLISLEGVILLLEDFRFFRASRLLRTIEPMNLEERLAFLILKAPNRFVPFLLRHRYIALALALNLPGNIVIGGGGGIALVASVSRLYSVPGFLTTIALAVSPVPLAILLFGHDFPPS